MTTQIDLLPAIPGVLGENYRFVDVARALGHDTATLKRLAAKGEFPAPFQVTPRDLRIEREAFEQWGRGQWRTPEQIMARRQIVRNAARSSVRQPPSARASLHVRTQKAVKDATKASAKRQTKRASTRRAPARRTDPAAPQQQRDER